MRNGAALNHPHIVRFFGASVQRGSEPYLCILLEFAAGGTLEADIRRQRQAGRRYEGDVVRRWVTQLALAVCYMHSRNILHGDLSAGDLAVRMSMPCVDNCRSEQTKYSLYCASEVLLLRTHVGRSIRQGFL